MVPQHLTGRYLSALFYLESFSIVSGVSLPAEANRVSPTPQRAVGIELLNAVQREELCVLINQVSHTGMI
jgi:hypothetical protein